MNFVQLCLLKFVVDDASLTAAALSFSVFAQSLQLSKSQTSTIKVGCVNNDG